MFPFGDVTTLRAQEVPVVGVGESVFGQVRLVSAPELTHVALEGLLTCRETKQTA